MALHGQPALVEQYGAVADRLDRAAVVGDDQQGGAGAAETADPLEALVLEVGIADRQRLVDDQHIGAARGGDAERQAHLHAARVGTHRLVDGFADLGELLDVRHHRLDLFQLQPQQLAGHEDVLPPGELRVEAHAQFEQSRDLAFDPDATGGRLGGPGDHLQQGALAGAVDPDYADRLPRADLEIHALQDPVQRMPRSRERPQPLAQARPAGRVLLVGLAQALDADRSHQSSSTISPERPRNSARPATHISRPSAQSGNRLAQSGQAPLRKRSW
ncbi:hypothetical protein D3C76_1006280 [compost metagenome]